MLINPRIKNLNILNMSEVIRTPEISFNFCEELGLVPRRDGECPSCPKCGDNMKAVNEIKLKLH